MVVVNTEILVLLVEEGEAVGIASLQLNRVER